MELLWNDVLPRLLDWRAPLEILIIAVGLYVLYTNLHAIGAWRIVAGILIGLGIFVASRMLALRGVEWILSRLSGVALLAVIILFQPEIRRLLERAISFRRAGAAGQQPQLSSLIADAVFDLARRKWGALVVLPGRESLAAWTSKGIALGATPSYPLLVSIFDPDSPGHDGAVVVDDGTVTSFGVRLPLSAGGELPPGYGTRHHAALGLSEVTDALVIVVSEERQAISACHRGVLHPMETKERLVERVHEHWGRTVEPSEGAPSTWRRHALTLPFLGCLVVATLFWLSIVPQRDEELEVALAVPVEYTASPPRLTLSGERVDRARVVVAGAAADLSRVDASRLRIRVDLSSVQPGSQLLPLPTADLTLPPGVRLLHVEPPSLALEFHPLVERELTVRPQLIGRPAEGFQVETLDVRPKTLRVLVPEGLPDLPTEILTTPIPLAGVSGRTRVIAGIVAPSGVRPLTERWPDIVVSLTVSPVAGTSGG